MSHFAKIENNLVTTVIVAEQEFIDTQDGVHYGKMDKMNLMVVLH
jgi:hypothetical protein